MEDGIYTKAKAIHVEAFHGENNTISFKSWWDYQGFYVENGIDGEEVRQGGPAEGNFAQ